jgi:hypothetical protein
VELIPHALKSFMKEDEMVKAIQVGILIALVVVAGLLFMVWRGQHAAQPASASAAQAPAPATSDANVAPPAPAPEPAAEPAPPVPEEPSPARRTRRAAGREVAQSLPPANPAPEVSNPAPPTPPAAEPEPVVEAPPAPQPVVVQAPPPPPVQHIEQPVAPPPPPSTVTLQPGTLLNVRLVDSLSSDKNQPGDSFHATLDQPLVVDGFVIAERGARVEGRVVESKKAGRVKGVSDLALRLTHLHTSDGQTVEIQTDPFEKEGETSHKSDAEKVGGGAALGAIIGAIAGGGRGAAIGAGAGGAAGGGAVLATRGKPVKLPSETRLSFRLNTPVALTERR